MHLRYVMELTVCCHDLHQYLQILEPFWCSILPFLLKMYCSGSDSYLMWLPSLSEFPMSPTGRKLSQMTYSIIRGVSGCSNMELFRGFFSKQADALFTPLLPHCRYCTHWVHSSPTAPARVGPLSADVTQMFGCHLGLWRPETQQNRYCGVGGSVRLKG